MSVEKLLIDYFKSLGIEVHTTTKARGNQGFFLNNRIDISKNIKPERVAPTLIHEFAHYIHSKIEPDMNKTGGTLYKLFGVDDEVIFNELINVTHFVDKNSLFERLMDRKKQLNNKIKLLDKEIKKEYPKFQRSKKFKEFDKYIKKSEAKYLLKYDRVKIVTGFLKKQVRLITVDSIENDFPNMPSAFCSYIRQVSARKKLKNISSRIYKYNKYYEKPAELFARYVESLYLNKSKTIEISPVTSKYFYKLLKGGYYFELSNIID
mgnify:CR=1 FL=1